MIAVLAAGTVGICFGWTLREMQRRAGPKLVPLAPMLDLLSATRECLRRAELRAAAAEERADAAEMGLGSEA